MLRTLLIALAFASFARADTVTLTSEGGFRWAKTERIAIAATDGKYTVRIERVPYDGQKQGPTELEITKDVYDGIVDVLTRNKALELKDDESKKGQVRDAPAYELSITLKDKTNTFKVFAPQMLHNEYTHIVDAIEAQAEKSLPTPQL